MTRSTNQYIPTQTTNDDRLQEQEVEAQMQWANEFNALLTQQGQELCVIGYEGFVRTGSKGAVAVSPLFEF